MAAAALKNRIENLIAMAQLLERVDANPTIVGAQQYLNLVNTVKTLLAEDDLPENALRAVARRISANRLSNPHGPSVQIDADSSEVSQLKSAAMPLLFSLREDQKNEVRTLARMIGLEQVAAQI